MKRSAMATHVKKRFLRSANVELDIPEADALDGYVVTPTGRSVLSKLADSLYGKSQTRAWTLTGPYGTGKSAFAIFAARLLQSGKIKSARDAKDLLSKTDSALANTLGGSAKSRSGLIPVAIVGTREPIGGAILRGFELAVNANLNGTGKGLAGEISRVRKQITDGKAVPTRRVTDLCLDSIGKLCEGSRDNNGVFLVIDELGKLLEYANHHNAQSDLFTLQELAEQFSRSETRSLLIGILHQDFGAYASSLPSADRAEWEKIRGRFQDISFNEPAEEMLRLVSHALAERGLKVSPAAKAMIHKIAEEAFKKGMNPGSMSKMEFVSTLEACAPLHPLVAISLGTVFRKFAQNERSVFSFINSNEPFGLAEFCRNQPSAGLFGVDRLYDYLTHSIRDALYTSMQAKQWAEAESILASAHDATESDTFLLKAITFINLIAQDNRTSATREVLTLTSAGCLPSPLEKKDFDRILKRKLVVDRSFNHTLGLWEGSDLDIEAEIQKARGQLDRDVSVAQLAEKYFPCDPVVARRHSYQTGTFRFFTVRFVSITQFESRKEELPLQIEIVLSESEAEERKLRTSLKKTPASTAPLGHLVCLPASRNEITSRIKELTAMEWVRENAKGFEGDRAARRELAIRIDAVQQQLSTLLTELLSPDEFSDVSQWFGGGAELSFGPKLAFQGHLSAVCDQVYDKSPRLLNELINRRQLSSAAASARRILIEKMFTHRNEPQLGLDKAPPEKSIYLSLLQNSGLHSETVDGWDFHPPGKSSRTAINATWSAINAFFRNTEAGARPVSDLFDVLRAPPYGLLDGPLPVLFCAALLVNDSELAMYKDGTFLPTPSSTDFELLVKHPNRYTIQRWNVSGVRAEVFQKLARLFGKEWSSKNPEKSQILDLVKPLLRFYQGLNKFTLNTRELSKEALAVRDALATATEPDALLFAKLPTAVGLKAFGNSKKTSSAQVEEYISRLRSALSELQTAYDKLLGAIHASLKTSFSISGDLAQIRRTLRERASGLTDCSGDVTLRSFVERIRESELPDRDWLETLSSLLILAQPATWKDGDLKRFQAELRSVARLFQHVEAIAFTKGGKRGQSTEAIRVGITRQDASESERVIHVSAAQKSEVEKAEAAIESLLKQTVKNKDIALAALAGVTQRRLSQ